MHPLKDMALTFGRGKSRHRPRNEPKLYGGKYPFIQTGDIRNCDHFITEFTQTYSEVGLPFKANYGLREHFASP